VKFSPIGSQIVIQMTEGETRPGVPVAPRSVLDRAARDAKDKKKKSMWSRVRISQSPERSPEGALVVECRVCLPCFGIYGSHIDSKSLHFPTYITHTSPVIRRNLSFCSDLSVIPPSCWNQMSPYLDPLASLLSCLPSSLCYHILRSDREDNGHRSRHF
jgi:hypothetical protein